VGRWTKIGSFHGKSKMTASSRKAAVVGVVAKVMVVRGVGTDFEGNVMGKCKVHRKFFVSKCKRQI
jgi:hypothetical protein